MNHMTSKRKQNWIIFSVSGLLLSLLSLLFPIITYTDRSGAAHPFNIIRLLGGGFAAAVQKEYVGGSLMVISGGAFDLIVAAVSLIGAAAIIVSFVGIRSMSKQYESQWPFRMTVCGLAGTAVPAVLLLIAYGLSANYYLGEISLGVYVVITPLAMLASVLAVVRRHRLTRMELEIQKEAANYIHIAGDLPMQ